MTSIAFILGIIPLAFAHGDGAQSRISLGTAVWAACSFSTVMNLAIVPVLYIVVIELTERRRQDTAAAAGDRRRRVSPQPPSRREGRCPKAGRPLQRFNGRRSARRPMPSRRRRASR